MVGRCALHPSTPPSVGYRTAGFRDSAIADLCEMMLQIAAVSSSALMIGAGRQTVSGYAATHRRLQSSWSTPAEHPRSCLDRLLEPWMVGLPACVKTRL